jgi:hypothetical protein
MRNRCTYGFPEPNLRFREQATDFSVRLSLGNAVLEVLLQFVTVSMVPDPLLAYNA